MKKLTFEPSDIRQAGKIYQVYTGNGFLHHFTRKQDATAFANATLREVASIATSTNELLIHIYTFYRENWLAFGMGKQVSHTWTDRDISKQIEIAETQLNQVYAIHWKGLDMGFVSCTKAAQALEHACKVLQEYFQFQRDAIQYHRIRTYEYNARLCVVRLREYGSTLAAKDYRSSFEKVSIREQFPELRNMPEHSKIKAI